MKKLPLLILLVGLGAVSPTVARAGGEIHGTIHTRDGRELTGPVRWDKNENFWDDYLDAQKDQRVKARETRTGVVIFGQDLTDLIPGMGWVHSQFSIPFGHIDFLEPAGRDRVRIGLKNGEVIQVVESSTDLGDSMRGLVILDAQEGEVDLEWSQVERVEFSQGPGSGRDAERLYGTVESRSGAYTGFIVWDRDESLREDVLDGRDADGKHKIPFAEIVEIRRNDRRSSRLTLKDGSQLTLTGTNDVDSGNRGVGITVPGLGVVKVSWSEFQKVVLRDPPPSPGYDQFDGGHKLRGKVTTAEGETYSGQILWDNDEEYSWETLDGEAEGVDHAILFENIHSIRRLSDDAAEIRLRGGQTLVLRESNDVNERNKGIQIQPEAGEAVVLGWRDLDQVTFATPP